MKKRYASLLLVFVLLAALLGGCGRQEQKITTGAIGVIYDEEFNNTYIARTEPVLSVH